MYTFQTRGTSVPHTGTFCSIFSSFKLPMRVAFLILLSFLGKNALKGCDPDRANLDQFSSSATLLAAPQGSGYDWAIRFELGNPTEPVKGFNGYSLVFQVEPGLGSSPEMIADWGDSWVTKGGSAFTSTLAFDPTTNEIALLISLDSCAHTSGSGWAGSILFKWDSGGGPPQSFIQNTIGQVMIENIDARPERTRGLEDKLTDTMPRTPTQGAKLYPNPASAYFWIHPDDPDNYLLRIFDTTGNLLREDQHLVGRTRVSLYGLPKGILLLELLYEDGRRESFRLVHL